MSTPTEPDWVQHAIWWHVYPLGFVGAETRADRDTGGDDADPPRLDRLTRWLDYAVELGVNGLALGPIFASGSHGYDTIDHFRIDPRLGDAEAFARLVTAARERGIRIMLDGVFNHVGRDFVGLDRARAGWLRRSRGGEVASFEGHDALLALDHDNPAVAEYVASVMSFWLDAGADAWRLDAAYAMPAPFWASVLPTVRLARPDAYVVGEMLHGDYAGYVARSGLDSVTQYELWKAIWSSVASANFFELDWALQRHAEFLHAFTPYTFIGNHDVTRPASRIQDERHRAHALVLLLVLGGTPAIYYGDERGWQAVKEDRVGGDDTVRPAFEADPVPLPAAEDAVFRLHQELIGLRRRHPWLHRAQAESVSVANEALVLRVSAGNESVVVALNLAAKELTVESVEAGEGGMLAGAAERAGSRWRVPAHGWAVLGPS